MRVSALMCHFSSVALIHSPATPPSQSLPLACTQTKVLLNKFYLWPREYKRRHLVGKSFASSQSSIAETMRA